MNYIPRRLSFKKGGASKARDAEVVSDRGRGFHLLLVGTSEFSFQAVWAVRREWSESGPLPTETAGADATRIECTSSCTPAVCGFTDPGLVLGHPLPSWGTHSRGPVARALEAMEPLPPDRHHSLIPLLQGTELLPINYKSLQES